MRFFRSINWHGVLAAAAGVVGLVSSPAVANLLPPQYSAILSAAAVVYAAVTPAAVDVAPPPPLALAPVAPAPAPVVDQAALQAAIDLIRAAGGTVGPAPVVHS